MTQEHEMPAKKARKPRERKPRQNASTQPQQQQSQGTEQQGGLPQQGASQRPYESRDPMAAADGRAVTPPPTREDDV